MEPQTPQDQTKKSYNPKDIEARFYALCEQRGYFEIEGNKALWGEAPKTFSLMMPPPNVTGVLHIGHALTFSLQDIITRFKRMDGYKSLYQPGLDHAVIATQNVVSKQLDAQGISKESLGREAFIAKVWEWKEQSGGQILSQMRHLGITPAWSRLRFTMDSGLQNAVKKAFVQWYEQGYIVQDNYMVNWCVNDGALSDIEVEYEANNGKLYYLRYPIVPRDCASHREVLSETNELSQTPLPVLGALTSESTLSESTDSKTPFDPSSPHLIVATTRPETFFGDSAVMVNPNDPRYTHLVGKHIALPMIGRSIPIIADSHVDMEFGTGCVKVTPAHDVNDYEVGKRHNLPFITIFDEKGILNAHAGDFEGRERLEAREEIVARLQNLGFVEKIEEHANQVGKCYRCGSVVEPYISKQWFVKKEVATRAIERVNAGELTFFPPQWLNNYNAWMRELRDWCISRQLWWGHRIPVWYCECGEKVASVSDNPTCPKCSQTITKQDDDVLDTWFSSGLWAFSTLGWGNGGEPNLDSETPLFSESDLREFYPTSLLITGFDILFFWVARMLLSGESLLNALPFKDVYLHALVRDENGQKMSKSKGNVIDPLEMIETYGADTLRFTLAYLCTQGRDVRLSKDTLEVNKAFTNKLYNATQFLLMYLEQLGGQEALKKGFGSLEQEISGLDSEITPITSPLGKYMLSRLYRASNEVRHALEGYRFNDGASILYRFLWGEFCDWGIELAKADKGAIYELGAIFKEALKLLHPYMPFISDYLWHRLNGSEIESSESIMIAAYPKAREISEDLEGIERDFSLIQDCIISIRRLKALLELGNAPLPLVKVRLKGRASDWVLLSQFVCKLARVESLERLDSELDSEIESGYVGDVSELCECFVRLEGIDLGSIVSRLNNQSQKLHKEIAKLEGMLDNANFVKNAPQAVIAQNQAALEAAKEKQASIESKLQSLRA